MFIELDQDPAVLPALTLAYVGDAVYELYVRQNLLANSVKTSKLHQYAIKRVNNTTQAKLFERVMDSLDEKEEAVAKRGRNAKSGQIPKNASVVDYRKSTGLEALIGYLYLSKQYERLEGILAQIEDIVGEAQQ